MTRQSLYHQQSRTLRTFEFPHFSVCLFYAPALRAPAPPARTPPGGRDYGLSSRQIWFREHAKLTTRSPLLQQVGDSGFTL